MKKFRIVEKEYWDEYWRERRLPLEIKKNKSLLLDEILEIMDFYIPPQKSKIIEIGGAPGQFLAYLKKTTDNDIYALDYSEIGCQKTLENFDLLNISGAVYQRDLFSDLSDLPKFDVVYSLGFIEHFSNLEPVIKKHLELLKPGGILIIGAPSFLGINKVIMEKICPERLSDHELSAMEIKNWDFISEKFNLQELFKGYIGGFEPRIYVYENKKVFTRLMWFLMYILRKIITDRLKFIRKINSKYFSSYVMGIYKKN